MRWSTALPVDLPRARAAEQRYGGRELEALRKEGHWDGGRPPAARNPPALMCPHLPAAASPPVCFVVIFTGSGSRCAHLCRITAPPPRSRLGGGAWGDCLIVEEGNGAQAVAVVE